MTKYRLEEELSRDLEGEKKEGRTRLVTELHLLLHDLLRFVV
jgi:hypothetical protein